MTTTAARVAQASKKTKLLRPQPVVSPFIGTDEPYNRFARHARIDSGSPVIITDMKYGAGGASRRGSHRIADASGCEVRWKYAYSDKLRTTKSNYYMDFGTLVHTGLAYHYAEQMKRKPQWFIDFPDRDKAMQEDSLGNSKWLRHAEEILLAHQNYYAGEAIEPLYCEEEFVTTVGQLDPDGDDEVALELEYRDVETGTEKVLRLPRLNDEEVSCRPDLIHAKNGFNWLDDHKTSGGDKKSGRLGIINPAYPDYTYYWQAMVNLHIVRLHMPIAGFIFRRIKRELPYDFATDLFDVPTVQYDEVPRTIRENVREERRRMIKIAKSERLIHRHFECRQTWTCSYAPLCYSESVEMRDMIKKLEFVVAK